VYAEYKVEKPKGWFFLSEVQAIDGKKLGEVQSNLTKAREELEKAGNKDPQAALDKLTAPEKAVYQASIAGDRKTLKADSFIPATMAVIYLLLLLYFKAIGGYKVVHLAGTGAADTKAS
jgi:DHA2 family metal-tetracycline-proton antiporter-like MFS transporter